MKKTLISLATFAATLAATALPVSADTFEPTGLIPFPDERFCVLRTVDTAEVYTVEWPNFEFVKGSVDPEPLLGWSSGAGPLPCMPVACPAPLSIGSTPGCYAGTSPFADPGEGYVAPVIPPTPAPLPAPVRVVIPDALVNATHVLGATSPDQ